MRVISSPKVVESADQAARAIIDTYLAPNETFPELRDMVEQGRLDLFAFSPRPVGQNSSAATAP
jgi:hypothetical protein